VDFFDASPSFPEVSLERGASFSAVPFVVFVVDELARLLAAGFRELERLRGAFFPSSSVGVVWVFEALKVLPPVLDLVRVPVEAAFGF
jgi:hypothetical protein